MLLEQPHASSPAGDGHQRSKGMIMNYEVRGAKQFEKHEMKKLSELCIGPRCCAFPATIPAAPPRNHANAKLRDLEEADLHTTRYRTSDLNTKMFTHESQWCERLVFSSAQNFIAYLLIHPSSPFQPSLFHYGVAVLV